MIRAGDAARLSGTRIQNRCPVTSTGLTALDLLMGGGLPVSGMCIVSEGASVKYSSIVRGYFVAEGVENGHDVVVMGASSAKFLDSVPGCSNDSAECTDMKIAWRYATMPAVTSGLSAKDKSRFDLAKPRTVISDNVTQHVLTTYKRLYELVAATLARPQHDVHKGTKLVRLVLTDVGSPIWEDSDNLLKFLSRLKLLLMKSSAVCLITVDESILDTSTLNYITMVSDAYFKLEAYDEVAKRDLSLEEGYDGRLHVVKLPRLNSFATNKPDCVDLVFEKHRHYLEIKTLHLPAVAGGADPPQTACRTVVGAF